MGESTGTASHWPKHATVWDLLGPPLRPGPQDVAAVTRALADRLAAPCRVLLLGATPELATLPWAPGSSLVAADRARAVMENVFPKSGVPADTTCVHADWTALPFERDRFDVVLGDGALTCLAYQAGYRALARELRRVVAPDAAIVLRLFTSVEPAESLDDIAGDLEDGVISSFHALKWRIAMACQSPSRDVAVGDVLAAFERLVPDWNATAAARGWSPELIRTIEPYRASSARYSFPTAVETRATFEPELEWSDEWYPDYELGDRCPTVLLRPRV